MSPRPAHDGRPAKVSDRSSSTSAWTVGRAPDDPTRLARVQRRFGEFAAEYAALPLYSTLCARLAEDDDLAALLLAAQPGQARPVLWLAAVHDLVLRRPDVAAARWYPSVVGRDAVPHGDPWPDVRRTVLDHWAELTRVVATRGTQTNEVNRAVYLTVGLAAAARDLPDVPVALVELGASAGLLLGVDRYAVDLVGPSSTVTVGDPSSPVRCSGVDRADVGQRLAAAAVRPRVAARVGLDLSPVDLRDDDAVRWLEACLWPDVQGRIERFRAARDLLRADPPLVLAGDMVADLPRAVARARELAGRTAHVVVVSSWALTYVAQPRRPEVDEALGALARDAAALSWLSAEPPGCVSRIAIPEGLERGGGTVVGLRRWRQGRELEPATLGTCHPHGEWVDLTLGPEPDRTS